MPKGRERSILCLKGTHMREKGREKPELDSFQRGKDENRSGATRRL